MADVVMKKFLDQAAAQALVNEIKTRDAATLQAAKDYCDGKDDQFEVAGAAATAEANAKAHAETKVNELANGAVKTNTEAIAKLNGAATEEGSVAKAIADAKALIDADIDAVEGKADKNAEDIAAINDATNGILAQAKAFATSEDAKVQANINELAGKVGDVPEDQTVMGIIAKIQSEAYDDTAIRGLIEGLDASKADKTQVATDIAAAVKVETDARVEAVAGVQGAVDALSGTHATDKKALEDAIALKADKTELEAVSAVANAAVKQADYDVKVKALEDEDVRIAGLVTAEAAKAREEEGKLDARLVEVETFFKTAEGETLDQAMDTLVEIQKYITEDGAAADEMIKNIDANAKAIEDHLKVNHDFAAADEALKSELNTEIAKKADKTTVEGIDGRVGTLETKVSGLEGDMEQAKKDIDAVELAVSTKAETQALTDAVAALEGADEVLAGRLDVIEEQLGDGEGSVSDQIADARQAAIDAAAADATTKADAAKDAAIAHANGLNTAMNARVEALEAVDHEHANKELLDTYTQTEANLADAVAKKHAHENATVLDGITAEKVTAWDSAEANAKAHADGLNTAMTSKVDAIDGRLTANETKASDNATAITNLTTKHNEDKATLEASIKANSDAIAQFVAITQDEITAMFASN